MNMNDDEAIGLLNRLLERLHQADLTNFGSHLQIVYVASGAQHVETIHTQYLGTPQSLSYNANYPTDEQLVNAISSINGKGKMLDEYQKWLGVCCYVSAKCGYPIDLDACCRRLAVLPYKEPLEYMPQYKSIRVYATWNFVKAGFNSWADFKPNDQERNLFVKCRDVALALEYVLKQNN